MKKEKTLYGKCTCCKKEAKFTFSDFIYWGENWHVECPKCNGYIDNVKRIAI